MELQNVERMEREGGEGLKLPPISGEGSNGGKRRSRSTGEKKPKRAKDGGFFLLSGGSCESQC